MREPRTLRRGAAFLIVALMSVAAVPAGFGVTMASPAQAVIKVADDHTSVHEAFSLEARLSEQAEVDLAVENGKIALSPAADSWSDSWSCPSVVAPLSLNGSNDKVSTKPGPVQVRSRCCTGDESAKRCVAQGSHRGSSAFNRADHG
jgi:hypothetical protein